MIKAEHGGELDRDLEGGTEARRKERSESIWHTALGVLLSAACYYLATQIAWTLCFPNSKVSLFFPPHAVLVSVLLVVPIRHWWLYTLSAIGGHLLATQQAHWPLLYSLHCEAFDAVQNVAVAAGLRLFIKSPLTSITLRDAVVFVLIAVIIVPFGTAFWGAAFTLSNHYGTHYWVEWRNLGVSNGVTAIALVPAILLGVHHLSARPLKAAARGQLLEAGLLGVGILTVGIFAFDNLPAGPDTSPALLYAPIPLLIWAAVRFGLGGMSASMLVVTLQAIWGTMHGRGPFLMQTPAENALALQLFLLVTTVPLMFLAVVIEEDKRSQQALRESESRLQLALEAGRMGVWAWDTGTHAFTWSKEYFAVLGLAPFSVKPSYAAWAGCVHPDDLLRAEGAMKEAAADGKHYRCEYKIRWPDQSVHCVEAHGQPMHNERGQCIRVMGLIVDITERKRAEEALRASEERYREVVESQTDLVCRHLADSTLTFANDAYCRFIGRRREELLGRRLLEFIPPHAREALSNHIASLNREHHGVTQEIEVSLPDESTVWFQWTAYPVRGTDGKVMEFQAIGHDISDRKRAEEARRNLAHAARVSTMGALAGSLAHELNQPLTAILSNAQAGSRFLGNPAPDFTEVQALLQDIAQDASRAGEVIRQLRILVKKDEPQLELLDLNRVVRDVVRLLHSDTLIKKVQILLLLEADLPCVGGDTVQLQQVILNLLLNAFDAIKDIAEVEREVQVCTRQPARGLVQLEVRDCGIGIPAKRLAKLFEPFQSTKRDGLGLGLSISRSIVEAHGGRLWAENNADRGATFCFAIPVAKEERTGKGPEGPES